jgi:hypothetical protein
MEAWLKYTKLIRPSSNWLEFSLVGMDPSVVTNSSSCRALDPSWMGGKKECSSPSTSTLKW